MRDLQLWLDKVIPILEANGGKFDLGDLFWASKLAEETGEYCGLVNKSHYEGKTIPEHRVAEELGDILICTLVICRKYGFDVEKLVKDKMKESAFRKENVSLDI